VRALLLCALAACTTGSDPAPAADAAVSVDATVTPVVLLPSCPATVAGTVQDSPSAFVPKETSIAVHQVVKFMITAEHFVIPNTLTTTDPALTVGRGQTKCFQFNTPGTYGFLCGVHSFTGTVVVQ